MTKLRTTRVGSLSRAHPLSLPFNMLPMNTGNTLKTHVHIHLRLHMRKSGAGRAPGQPRADTTRLHGACNDTRARTRQPIDPLIVF